MAERRQRRRGRQYITKYQRELLKKELVAVCRAVLRVTYEKDDPEIAGYYHNEVADELGEEVTRCVAKYISPHYASMVGQMREDRTDFIDPEKGY